MNRLRQIYLIGALAVVLAGLSPIGQAAGQEATALSRLRDAFVAGDAHALLDSAADRVEIALPGSSKLYSRAQATYVMEDFFGSYPAGHFTLQSESRTEGSWIAAGEYGYKGAKRPLQVYVRFRMKGTQWELREIRIEERQHDL